MGRAIRPAGAAAGFDRAQDGRLLAALPLVRRRVAAVLPVGDLPINCWSPNGELLLDAAAGPEVLDCLLAGLGRLPWPLLWLQTVPFDAPRWQALRAAAQRHGWRIAARPHYTIGQIELASGFEKYAAGWSKNHRRNVLEGSPPVGAGGARAAVALR